jgi:hypothetical protein
MTKKNRISKTCEHCGKQFEVRASNSNAHYCSRACYMAHGGAGKNTPNYKRKALYGEVPGRKSIYMGRDDNGKQVWVARSHVVWNAAYPDDPVLPGEEVHHKDRNKGNDAIDNLVKMNASEHHRQHALQITTEERSRRMKEWWQTVDPAERSRLMRPVWEKHQGK